MGEGVRWLEAERFCEASLNRHDLPCTYQRNADRGPVRAKNVNVLPRQGCPVRVKAAQKNGCATAKSSRRSAMSLSLAARSAWALCIPFDRFLKNSAMS